MVRGFEQVSGMSFETLGELERLLQGNLIRGFERRGIFHLKKNITHFEDLGESFSIFFTFLAEKEAMRPPRRRLQSVFLYNSQDANDNWIPSKYEVDS